MSTEVKSKELRIRVAAGKGCMREIYWEGGGEVPKSLNGLYTSIQDAQKGIQKYMANKEDSKDESIQSKPRSKKLPERVED